MTSFFMNCPQCGVMIPKGSPCSDCRWSEGGEVAAVPSQDLIQAFSFRQKIHAFNFAVSMILMFATGLIGLLTAYMWFRVIYFGNVSAFMLIGFLTVLTGVLSVVTACSKKLFPVDLNCPACDIRLDEVGLEGDHCPSCPAQLK